MIDQQSIADRIASACLDEPYDLDTEPDRSRDPEAARALYSLMRSISEECYCAGWMSGLEDALWRMLNGGSRRYGQGEDASEDRTVTETSVAALRHLHERCGGWWTWHDDTTGAGPDPSQWGARFVTIEEWTR